MTTPVQPIEQRDDVQFVNVRLYFVKDQDPALIRDRITVALQGSADLGLVGLIAAYEMVPDGFGRLVLDSRPLA